MGWDNNSEILAGILDALNALIRLTYNAHAQTPDKSEVPRFARPHEEEQVRESVSFAEFIQIMNGG